MNENHYIQHFPAVGQPKAYALVVHGLNNKPESMCGIIGVLNSLKIYAVNVSLAGHSNRSLSVSDQKILLAEFRQATRESWQDQLANAVSIIDILRQSKPVYLVAYSAGAVLTIDLIQRQNLEFDKFVLFAPALSFRNTYRLLHFLPFNSMLIPSFLGAAFRSNRGTPISAYKTIVNVSQNCHTNAIDTCLNIPALVVMDPKDELLSVKGLRRFISENHLIGWQILLIDGGSGKGNYHHLVFNREFVGDDNWRIICNEIDGFLNTD